MNKYVRSKVNFDYTNDTNTSSGPLVADKNSDVEVLVFSGTYTATYDENQKAIQCVLGFRNYTNYKVVDNNIYVYDGMMTYIIDKKSYTIVDVFSSGISDDHDISVVKNIDMFSDTAAANEYYGGAQKSLYANRSSYLTDEYVLDIISKYYDIDSVDNDDLSLLFYRMKKSGCGYVAAANMLFENTLNLSDSEFQEKFGFPRYKVVKNDNDEYIRVFNYEYMFLDYYLFYNSAEGYKTIQDVYGNAEEEKEFYANDNDTDSSLSNEKFDREGADGIDADEQKKHLKEYLKEKGFDYDIKLSRAGEDSNFERRYNNIKKYLKEGYTVSIGMKNFPIYYAEDIDNNGKLDDIYKENVGAHQMVVSEVLDDGRLVVSSWGKKFIVDPVLPNNYDDFNDVNYDSSDTEATGDLTPNIRNITVLDIKE